MYYEAFFNETGPGVGPIPWTHKRGPAVWERRLREHWSARGINVTEDYLKVALTRDPLLCTAGLTYNADSVTSDARQNINKPS